MKFFSSFRGAPNLTAVAANPCVQQEQVAAYKAALAAGDKEAANAARDAMWTALYQVHKAIGAWDDAWNTFTARTVEME
ncbi:MAG: hypothetical protein R3C14_17945 [Caldilineaceae bacterium]